MPTYLIQSNSSADSRKLILRAANPLSDVDIQEITTHKSEIHALFRGTAERAITLMDWDALRARLSAPLSQDVTLPEPEVKIREISLSALKRPRRTVLAQLYTLRRAWPSRVPLLRFLWAMIIIPLLAIGRLLDPSYKRKIAELELGARGAHYQSPQQFLTDLQRYTESFRKGLHLADGGVPEGITTHLDAMLQNGAKLQAALKSKGSNLYQLSQEFAQAICRQGAVDPLPSSCLFSLPTGIMRDGRYYPILASFVLDADKKICLELHFYGKPPSDKLHTNYHFDLKPGDPKSEQVLTDVLHALIHTNAEHQGEILRFGNRTEIRLGLVAQFKMSETPTQEIPATPNDPADWLHQLLYSSGGVPLESPVDGVKQTESLFGFMQEGLQSFFPEASFPDKLEFLLALITEQCDRYLAATPFLSRRQAMRQLSLLRYQIQKVEDHLSKRISPDEMENLKTTQFANFYQRVELLNKQYGKVESALRLGRQKEIAKHLRGKQEAYHLKVNVPQDLQNKVKSENHATSPLSVDFKVQLAPLSAAVTSGDRQAVAEALGQIHTQCDAQIAAKDYLAAKRLAEEALALLPVPSSTPNTFWRFGPRELAIADNCSRHIASLNQDIWESALRLNLKYPEPAQLIQMIKSQTILLRLARFQGEHGTDNRFRDEFKRYTIDVEEIGKLLELHPHLRMGWLPEHQHTAREILAYLALPDASGQILRLDTAINNQSLGEFTSERGSVVNLDRSPLFKQMSRKQNGSYAYNDLPPELIDIRRTQVMMTSLVKPDYSLCRHFDTGVANQATGLVFLDGLAREAKARGASTPEEMREYVKAIRLEGVQEELKGMKRLDIAPGVFVTEFTVTKIVDRKGSGRGVAILPNGYGLPGNLVEVHDIPNTQKNSQDAVGVIRGEGAYVAPRDGNEVSFTRPQKIEWSGVRSTLSPQRGNTEPTLLTQNLQKPPKRQIGQISNYNIESSYIAEGDLGDRSAGWDSFFDAVRRGGIRIYSDSSGHTNTLSPRSVMEVLNIVRSESYLVHHAEVQRTILLGITRPDLLKRAMIEDPLFFKIYAEDIRRLLVQNAQDNQVAPFLLLLGDILSKNAQEIQTDSPADFPTFEGDLQIGDVTETGLRWVERWLEDDARDKGILSTCYLYAKYQTEPAGWTEEIGAQILRAGAIFMQTGDSVGLPIFNRMIERWLIEEAVPAMQAKGVADRVMWNSLLNRWVGLAMNISDYVSPDPWMASPRASHVLENRDFRLNLNTCAIESKNPDFVLEGLQVEIPPQITGSADFLKLFGNESIRATVQRGGSPTEFIYEFKRDKVLYRISYDQRNGTAAICRQMPVDLKKPERNLSWFRYLSLESQEDTSLSPIEKIAQKQGIWINEKKPSQAYLWTYPPKDKKSTVPFRISLTKEGKFSRVRDGQFGLDVVTDQEHKLGQYVPFSHPDDTLFLCSPKTGRVRSVMFPLQDSSLLLTKEGSWKYRDDRLGAGYTWLTDHSPDKLLLFSNSSARHLLDAIGPQHEQFILPLTNGSSHVFLLQPHLIDMKKGKLSPEILPASYPWTRQSIPLTVSFDETGKIEGSPSAFLYLSYYFSFQKKYQFAEHFLNLAMMAPSPSEKELLAFKEIGSLFGKIDSKSIRSVAFQLRAHLAIHSITTRQFSQPLFEPDRDDQFLAMSQRIAELHKVYQARKGELTEGVLSAEELYEIEQMVRSSLREFLDLYQEKVDKTPEKIIEAPANLSRMSLDLDLLKQPPAKFAETVVLLARGLNKSRNLDQLFKRGAPDEAHLVKSFITYLKAIDRADAATLRRAIAFLVLPMARSHRDKYKVKDQHEMGEYARQYLLAACFKKLSNPDEQLLPDWGVQLLSAAKSRLPYFSRAKRGPLAYFWSLMDLRFLKTYDKVNQVIGGLNQALIQGIASMGGSGKIDFAKLGTDGDDSFPFRLPVVVKDDQKESLRGASMLTSLQTILDYFENPPMDSPFTSLEKEVIPQMIRAESYDLNVARKMPTLVQESKARQFSVLEVRTDFENMRKIEQLEKKLSSLPPVDLEVQKQQFNTPDFSPIQSEMERLQNLLEPLATPGPTEKASQQRQIEELKLKLARAEDYFSSENEDLSPLQKEENRQLLLGFKQVQPKLEAEIALKKQFTKDEIKSIYQFLTTELNAKKEGSLKSKVETARKELLEQLMGDGALPAQLQKMKQQPAIYTDYDLIQEILRLYKDPAHAPIMKHYDQSITQYLFLLSAEQQCAKALALLKKKKDPVHARKALDLMTAGFRMDRYLSNGQFVDPLFFRKCLVAEGREGIIFRPEQLSVIEALFKDPNQYRSLRMGMGKTTNVMPALADLIASTGKFVVFTVPENLLKGNRILFDGKTRTSFDQAGVEFHIPMEENLPLNYLSEKYLQLLKLVEEKGYLVTSVEELASLHNRIVQMENDKAQLLASGNRHLSLLSSERKLHYLKKIQRLLRGEAKEINVVSQFFGDEVDSTYNVTREVNQAIGKQVPLEKTIRNVCSMMFEKILTAAQGDPLEGLKQLLLTGTKDVLDPPTVDAWCRQIATAMYGDPEFIKLFPADSSLIDHENHCFKCSADQWEKFVTGQLDKYPEGIPEWTEERKDQLKPIAALKQILSSTLKGMISQKAGIDSGLSDTGGFMSVPKVTQYETKGMRFGDEFELILAQFMSYFELKSSKGLTEASDEFLQSALQTFRYKFPSEYAKLVEDHARSQRDVDATCRLSVIEFVKEPEAWRHRFAILDKIVFEQGYIQRFDLQINTNVQEVVKGGGVTGTLNPYELPFLTKEVLFGLAKAGEEEISTRLVEAETIARVILNQPEGLDTPVSVYDHKNPMVHVQQAILGDPHCAGFINNSGDTLAGKDTLSWVAEARQTPEGKERSFLFIHPKYRVPYLWPATSTEAVPYKAQQLPPHTICFYPPVDGRGVDLPMGSGNVDMFFGPTSNFQEVMQAIYRARQVGAGQVIKPHLSDALTDVMPRLDATKDVTYGDMFNYCLQRSTPTKEATNLRAQLQKVESQLKLLSSEYISQVNPDFDKVDTWDLSKVDALFEYMAQSAVVFSALRAFYITDKAVNFEQAYVPQKTIPGVEKPERAFDAQMERIDKLRIDLKAAFLGLVSQLEIGRAALFVGRALQELMHLANHPRVQPVYSPIKGFADQLTQADALADRSKLGALLLQFEDNYPALELNIDQLMSDFPAFQDKLTKLKKALEVFLLKIEIPGKRDLMQDLLNLKKKLAEQKQQYLDDRDLHARHLPETTTATSTGSAGVREQVKVFEQAKTKTQEVEETDGAAAKPVDPQQRRDYVPLDYNALAGFGSIHPLETFAPFDTLQISPEAREVLKRLPPYTGEPLLYLAVAIVGGLPIVTLISKQDYHRVIAPKIAKGETPGSADSLNIFSLTTEGFSQFSGTEECSWSYGDLLHLAMLPAKVYLGVKEFSDAELPHVKNWLQELDLGAYTALGEHIRQRCAGSLRKKIEELAGRDF